MADEANKIIDITPDDIYLATQQIQRRYVKFVILNRQWAEIGEIKGQVISGNINIDASNNIRRTASLEMIVSHESMEDAANFTMQNYIQVWCGILKNIDETVKWYNYGIFIVNNHSYKFDPTTRTLTITLADLMSDLNGDRGGVLHAYTAIAKNSERIDAVIKNVLKLCGYEAYDIIPIGAQSKTDDIFELDTTVTMEESLRILREVLHYTEEQIEEILSTPETRQQVVPYNHVDERYLIPYDLKFNVGVTAYEIIEKLVSLYPYYRMRFSVDGTFIVDNVILEHDESSALLSAEELMRFVISEDKTIDWTKIKNHIEVWGKDGKYYGEAIDNNPLSPFQVASIGTLRAVYSGDIYDNIYDRYKHPDKVAGYMKDQAKYEAEIAELKSQKPTSKDEEKEIAKKLADAKINLDKAKASINRDIDIRGNDMAKDYAEKLLYETCRINDTLTLQTIFLPFLNEVDFKIQHKSSLDGSNHTYVLKSVSHDLKSGTSTLNAVRFYDEVQQSELVQLDTPTIVSHSVDGMTVTIIASEVPYATTYQLYGDLNVIDISNTPIFVYKMSDGYAGEHSFRVSALATGYRESNLSAVVRINLTSDVSLVDEEGNEIITENNDRIIIES